MLQLRATRLVVALGCLLLLATACAPRGVARAAKPTLDEPPRAAPFPRDSAVAVVVSEDGCELDVEVSAGDWSTDMDLRGDPDFEPADLPPAVRCWYEELWRVLSSPGRADYFTGRAKTADLYIYARTINTHITTLLAAFRVTGDLAILDEISRLTQHMRAALDDAWTGRYASAAGSVDGYLNWVWDQGHSDTHRGRDIIVMDEMRAHALMAQVAYVFTENADLESPNGVDYAERGAFWLDYLSEHFEPKWRDRNNVRWPRFPFMQRSYTHEMFEFTRYHHYMYLLTGEEPYAREAKRISELVFENFREADTDSGPALVTPHGIRSMGADFLYLMPSTYFRYVVSTALDLHFEGVAPWSDDTVMAKLARTLSEFVLDEEGDGFGRDVGGGHSRAGLDPTPEREWARLSIATYNGSPFALLSAWDSTDKIVELASEIHVSVGSGELNVFMPVSGLLHAAIGGGAVTASGD